jgi:hypothetical protein
MVSIFGSEPTAVLLWKRTPTPSLVGSVTQLLIRYEGPAVWYTPLLGHS